MRVLVYPAGPSPKDPVLFDVLRLEECCFVDRLETRAREPPVRVIGCEDGGLLPAARVPDVLYQEAAIRLETPCGERALQRLPFGGPILTELRSLILTPGTERIHRIRAGRVLLLEDREGSEYLVRVVARTLLAPGVDRPGSPLELDLDRSSILIHDVAIRPALLHEPSPHRGSSRVDPPLDQRRPYQRPRRLIRR